MKKKKKSLNYLKTINKTITRHCRNYQQLSSRASLKRLSIVAGSPKSHRPIFERSSPSDDFHGKTRSKILVDLTGDEEGDSFVVLWLTRGCESISIAADGAIELA